MFALVDCNNFYASCERAFNPALNGRPVVVLSNNDGCVIARSNEAKELGIEMGAPAFQIEEFLKENTVEVFSSNYALYGDMSQRVMDTLSDFSPNIEVYSIDESFLSLSGFELYNLLDYAASIKKKVHRNTGIPVSVGIGPTKTLAKLANKLAKKNAENKGVFAIDETNRIEALKSLSIDKVWGIGPKYSRLLESNDVKTPYDFTQVSKEWVQKNMSIVGVRTQKELLGIPCIELEEIAPTKKNICVGRSFGKMQTDYSDVEEALASFAASCAYKLRKQKSCANVIMVFLNTNPHRHDLAQYGRNRVVTLPVPTNSTIEIVKYAKIALKGIFRKGYHYKKVGIILSELVPENIVQTALFDNVDRGKHSLVMNALDRTNRRFGKDTVRLAIQGYTKRWKLRQERLSPCYTTRWSDIIKVKV